MVYNWTWHRTIMTLSHSVAEHRDTGDDNPVLHVMTFNAPPVEFGYVHDVHRFPVGEDQVVNTVHSGHQVTA